MPGFFLTVEGIDGAGKSTLIELLYQHFREVQKRLIVKTFEPGDTPFGHKIRNFLLHEKNLYLQTQHSTELFLFLADRSQHVDVLIQPALSEDMIVICDRFTDSSLAYQVLSKMYMEKGRIKQKELQIAKKICTFAANGLEPNLTLYLDADPKVSLSRLYGKKKDLIEERGLSYYENVRRGYLHLANTNKKRIMTLDATKPPEMILQKALSCISLPP